MKTNFGSGIAYWLEIKRMTQKDLSVMSGLSEPGITRIIKWSRRPDEKSLKALCNHWGDKHVELTLVCHHLRDEIIRAGKQNKDFNVDVNDSAMSGSLEDDIQLIKSEAQEWEDVRTLLHELAHMIRRSSTKSIKLSAAEDRATYTTKQKKAP